MNRKATGSFSFLPSLTTARVPKIPEIEKPQSAISFSMYH